MKNNEEELLEGKTIIDNKNDTLEKMGRQNESLQQKIADQKNEMINKKCELKHLKLQLIDEYYRSCLAEQRE